MSRIASQVLISRLADWGVDTVFGLPGDGINGIMEGLRRNADRVRFVLVHHEEAAAFMAAGHAKATGRIGVCLATSGPGGIHLANGLYDAKLDHAPVLAITGMQETSVLGTGYQQEVHLDRFFEDVAEYNQVVVNPVQLPALVDLAIRTAYARRGVAHLTVPNDIQVADADADPWQHVAPAEPPATAPVYLPPPVRPRQQDVQAAADVLNAGQRAAILVGIGARGAGPLVEQVADRLAAPIIKTLPGKMVVPDDSPYCTGGLGLLGTEPSEELVDDIDTLLMLGTNFPYTKHLPAPGKARVVQVDLEPPGPGCEFRPDRSNFRERYWRPAWNGVKPDEPAAEDHLPPILPWFTFHEGRHSHATWLAEDGVPEVAGRARLGHKMRGMARVYDHVTPVMEQQICDVLQARWTGSLLALTSAERVRLVTRVPHLRETIDELEAQQQSRGVSHCPKSISQRSPTTA